MTIDYRYWERDRKHHCARQIEKEALESHFQKQGRAFTSGSAIASQNKANPFPVASSTKNSSSKLSLSSALKKQPNTLWVDLSSKLASNGKLTSDEHKKRLENNLCLYCGVGDHKLDSCLKKYLFQELQCFSNCFQETLGKIESNPQDSAQTLHRLKAVLNFLV